MKKIAIFALIAGAASIGCALVHGRSDEPAEPFYRKYLVVGNPLDDSIVEMERRVESHPDSADLRNDFGNLLAERRFYEDAARQYEKAIDLDESHFLAAYNLGLLWEAAGKPNLAISAYRKSIARKPGFPSSHFHLGRLYEHRGWESRAVKEYAKALRIDPGMRDPRVNPLVVDSRLLDLASLENYRRDIAVAALAADQAWAENGGSRRLPTDRPLSSSEIEDPAEPEPIDAEVTAPLPPGQPGRIDLGAGQTRPQALPPGAPPLPPPTPVP